MAGKRTISLALGEGFLNDRVRVVSDGRELASFENLSTRVQIGLARTVELEVEDGAALTIELPDKQLKTGVEVAPGLPAHVGVSVTPDGKALAVRTSEEPPGYV